MLGTYVLQGGPAKRSVPGAGIMRIVADGTQFGSANAFQRHWCCKSARTRSLAEMMSGMIRERVTDQRDSSLGLRWGFIRAIVSRREMGGHRPLHQTVLCCRPGENPGGKNRIWCGSWERLVTKRKVIGTIENTRLLCLAWRVCVLVHTSASLQNARSVFDRIQRQPAGVLRSLFSFPLSLSYSALSLPLSLPRPPTPSG